WFRASLWLAFGSGLVATLSMLPGTLLLGLVEPLNGRGGKVAQRIASGMSLAMIFRLFGTVALFALSSYHIPEKRHEAAGLILGWYLYLTAIEVFVIARRLPNFDVGTTPSLGPAWVSSKPQHQSFNSDTRTTAKP
ncbi:MAG: hypothetical protein AAF802_30220, partial [Planctomycetota bacterium]